jgi:hypothetical protein
VTLKPVGGCGHSKEAVRAVALIAVSEHTQRAASVRVPTEIVYRTGWLAAAAR